MIRTQLIDFLNFCAPALARSEFVPIMSHFCFTGTHVYAFNDQIGVIVPLATDFKGGVNGEVLMGLLRQSRADTVELEQIEGDNLQVKLGKTSRIKLGLRPVDQFVWENVPVPNPKKLIDIGAKRGVFLHHLQAVMQSISTDTTIPDQLGVAFIPEPEGVSMYATDSNTMSHAYFELSKKWPSRVILPASFCNQLKAIAGTADNLKLEVHEDHVLAVCDDVVLYSRVIESERPYDFQKYFAQYLPPKLRKQMVLIPKLKLPLERACIMASGRSSDTMTAFTIAGGRLKLTTQSPERGDCFDSLRIDESHPDVKIYGSARHIKDAIDMYHSNDPEENGSMVISDNIFALTLEGSMTFLHQVSTTPPKAKK